MKFKVFPDPGKLPTLPPPNVGERFSLSLPGLPPRKQRHRSCRNPKHPHYDRFVLLREAATNAMRGRQWFLGTVGLDLLMFGPERLHWLVANEYIGGIMDTLGGCHGTSFTYLPVVYQDDCQVISMSTNFQIESSPRYTLDVSFIQSQAHPS
ncbi:hypothetical protein [Prosthecobacter vanneervenii]|uniref:Uncharacterized protein n=1 Tax=Prosthecobacter vanneervenii TaxID=48466 RepID=A0A7W8DLW0_9BACT|nr:hypothetical protein [Prosthecobacter vanneervenii]MBB5034251.1 hypothetical protein [Prosthecobacter vanneervenii]